MTVVTSKTKKTADLMDRSRGLPIHHFLDFTRINRYTVLGDGMTHKFDGIKLKFTFREFGIQMVISQTLKNNMKMSSMIIKIFRIDQNIVDKNHDEFIEFRHEDRVHEIHEICRCIGKTKGHNQVFIESISGGESCFRNITWPKLYLMIPRTKVNFGEYLGSG
jgi:uncharacterized protein YeaC (DUF1315 family)